MNINDMMQQAKQMQEQMQKRMADMRVEATAGGGMVTVAVNGDGTYSFVLVGQSSNGLGVASREATSTNRPRLVVTFD